MSQHSDYIVYVDESGDHGLRSIDPEYPVFVLAFCIFLKQDYSSTVSAALQDFKFRHFGHDMVILHERDISKAQGQFKFLANAERRSAFLEDLTSLIANAPFTLVASVIQKKKLLQKYYRPDNPYNVALAFGMERIASFLRSKRCLGQTTTHVVFERRGKKEDGELELQFRRVCGGQNYRNQIFPFEITLADKRVNCCGLQLADLIARPIGRKIIDSGQSNRAWDIIEKKLYREAGRFEGYGLKIFP